MELAFNLALAAGIIVEILLLWETSDRQRNIPLTAGILAPGVSRFQEIIALVVLVAWTLILLAEFFNPTLSLEALSFLQNAIMGPAMFFLLVFGLWYPKLLPRINEQTLVVITAIALLSFPNLLNNLFSLDWYWLAALSILLAIMLVLAFTKIILAAWLKSLLYFWYLICLLVMAYLSSYDLFFNPETNSLATSFDHFIAGAAGIFFFLHSVFLVRFFLMLTANVLPWNRYLIALAMPQLFGDEQMPPYQFLVILLLVVSVLLLNVQFGFVPDLNLASLLILFVVHFMDRAAHGVPKTL